MSEQLIAAILRTKQLQKSLQMLTKINVFYKMKIKLTIKLVVFFSHAMA